MKKALITRYGAFGDQIHCSHIPRLLKEKEGFDYVAFEYNPKGFKIFQNNPYIDEHIHFDPHIKPICFYPMSFIEKRWKTMVEEGGFDKHVNLQNSLEYGYIAMEDTNEFYRDSEYRRDKYGRLNFYDQCTVYAGYPQHKGMVGELYFTEEEEAIVKGVYERKYKDVYVIICNLSGSSKQKLFIDAKEIITEFLKRHPNAVCITMGDKDVQDRLEWDGERVIKRANVYDFRQTMLMTKYADCVIGYESGLMVASTLLGTPTIQLMTTSSIKNHGGDFPNDFSLQAPIYCSPCHKGVYDCIGCPTFKHNGINHPKCIQFDPEVILERMEQVYDYSRKSKTTESPSLSSV